MATYEYKIAAGHNNAAGLTNIEDITPSSDVAFYPPVAYNKLSKGVVRVRADHTRYTTGVLQTRWEFAVMTRRQWRYLQSTFTTGGNSYSGLVTIRTMNAETGSYTNYNATIVLTPPSAYQPSPLAYEDVEVLFDEMTAI